MLWRTKPLSEWKEIDYLLAHKVLWEEILRRVKAGHDLHLTIDVKANIIKYKMRITDVKIDSFLCAIYDCTSCPLRHPQGDCYYYHKLLECLERSRIIEVINIIIHCVDGRLDYLTTLEQEDKQC